MVAGDGSCSCPECGVVCSGKFAGCSAVWAAGPKAITLRRPSKKPGQRALAAVASTNGRRSHDVPNGGPPALPMVTGAPISDVGGDLRPLLLELQAAIESLPAKFSKVAGEAMRRQHETNRQDLADLWGQIAEEARTINRPDHGHGTAVDGDAVMRVADDRFQWLVNEMSKRFVVFGNELSRIEKRLAGPNNGVIAGGNSGVTAQNRYGDPDRTTKP
jgi:hypothetical protein